MALIYSPYSKKLISTERIPNNLDPIYCCECGRRLGWVNTDHEDRPLWLYCDDCAADQSEAVVEEPE